MIAKIAKRVLVVACAVLAAACAGLSSGPTPDDVPTPPATRVAAATEAPADRVDSDSASDAERRIWSDGTTIYAYEATRASAELDATRTALEWQATRDAHILDATRSALDRAAAAPPATGPARQTALDWQDIHNLDECIKATFGSYSFTSGGNGELMLALGRYRDLTPGEQFVIRHLLGNSGSDALNRCEDWLGEFDLD